MSRPLVLALVAVVVLAGCSTGSPTETGSPAAGTAGPPAAGTGPATATPSGYPPGVGEDGLKNLTALLEANQEALDETGYVTTARSNLTVGGDGLAVNEVRRSTVRAEAGGREVYERHVVNNSVQGNATTELWANRTVTLIRDFEETSPREEPRVRFRTAPSPESAFIERTGSVGTVLLLRLVRFDVAGRSDGRTTLTAAGVNRTLFERVYGENGTVVDLAADLVVDARGRIRSFEGSLVAEPGANASGAIDSIHASYELTAVGTVEVRRPDWVPAAYDAVPVFEASIEVIDGTYVAVTNEGPDPIPAGVAVGLFEDSGGTVRTLQEPVAPGETIYLYKPTDSPGPGVARERPDAPARTLSGTYTVHLSRSRGDVLFEEEVTVEGG